MTLRTATIFALLTAAACTRPQPALYASAANQPAYAERYPTALADTRTMYAADEQQTRAQVAEFQKFPAALDKPSWPVVLEVVKAADQAGKSGDWAGGMAETEAVRSFFTRGKEHLHQKVAGSVDYAAKQKQIEAPELASAAVGGMDRAVDQELEDNLHARNPAVRLVEDNQDAIGKQNVDKLTKQVDQLSLASYVVHVRMPQTKRNLDAALAEASDVKKTLEEDQKRAEAVMADKAASRDAKKTAEKRQKAAFSALAALDGEVSAGKKLSSEMDKRAESAKKEYDQALKALQADIEGRAKAADTKK